LYAFAKRVGVPGTSLARALGGKRGLSLDVAARVEEATRGKVPAKCWARPRRRSETGGAVRVTRRAVA